MAYKIEFHKGSELHVRARKQKQLFLGGLIVACILYAIGTYNNPSFFEKGATFFVLLWCLCIPVAFNGAVCESIAEFYIEHDNGENQSSNTEETAQANNANSSWYTASFFSVIAIPAITAVIAVILTFQPAYLLIAPIAIYFAFRNNKLYRELTK